MYMITTYKVMRDGRRWQVWDTTQQVCKGGHWSKKAAEIHKAELERGIDRYHAAIHPPIEDDPRMEAANEFF